MPDAERADERLIAAHSSARRTPLGTLDCGIREHHRFRPTQLEG